MKERSWIIGDRIPQCECLFFFNQFIKVWKTWVVINWKEALPETISMPLSLSLLLSNQLIVGVLLLSVKTTRFFATISISQSLLSNFKSPDWSVLSSKLGIETQIFRLTWIPWYGPNICVNIFAAKEWYKPGPHDTLLLQIHCQFRRDMKWNLSCLLYQYYPLAL